MTGFARIRKEIPQGELVFSLKSVNHRGLDLHFHMPNELDALENDVRTVIKSGVSRGHLQIHCGIARTAAAGAAPLNRTLLTAYMAAFGEAAKLYQVSGGPDLNSALRIPGMLTEGDQEELGADAAKAVLDGGGGSGGGTQ